MTIMKIEKIIAREILDSRANPTVEVEMHSKGKVAIAASPSGASTGKFEALELRDGDNRFHGKGVRKAVGNIMKKVAPEALKREFGSIADFDGFLLQIDGTDNKGNLGGNSTTACSLCFARLFAMLQNKEMYEVLGKNHRLPIPFANVINGGKHAGNKLAIQEFMLVPLGNSYSESVRMVSEVYHGLKESLKKKYGVNAVNVGDEGGFAPDINSAREALDQLHDAIDSQGYSKHMRISMDSAASSFYDEKKKNYRIDGKVLSSGELTDYYYALVKEYRIFSLEDPFYEEDYDVFAELLKKVKGKCKIVGDDLVVTNIKRVREAVKRKSMDMLLLKVNQIGTVTEALEAAQFMHSNAMDVMVSHRSGETEDSSIADIATGISSLGIKLGAPARSERAAKYNRLLRIAERIGDENYAGKLLR